MNLKRLSSITALTLAGAVALAGCATNDDTDGGNDNNNASTLSGTIAGSGASSQGAAQEAWAAEFQKLHEDVTIEYDGGGSGAGRDAFKAGAVAFAGSDRAFKLDEIEAGGFETCAPESDLVELPLYISPIAIAFNIEGIDSLNLDAATVAKIFTGEITNWNDPAIAAHNEGVALPDLAITAIHRADKSGTTGNFTKYLEAVAPEAWTHGSVEEWPLSGGEAVNQTSGVASALSGGNGTIGYLDASRAPGSTVAIKVGDDYVSYSAAAAAKVVDASSLEDGRAATDISYKLDYATTEAGAYPIVLISYLIGCAEYKDAAQGELVKEYFSYIASEAGQNAGAAAAGNAPISSDLRQKVEAAIAAIK